MCDSWWSLDLVSVVFVTMESNPGQCLFTLDDAFFPVAYGGKRFLDCVWVRLLPMGLRDDMQERSYLTCSLYCPWGERKTLRVWVRLLWCPKFITKKKKKRSQILTHTWAPPTYPLNSQPHKHHKISLPHPWPAILLTFSSLFFLFTQKQTHSYLPSHTPTSASLHHLHHLFRQDHNKAL